MSRRGATGNPWTHRGLNLIRGFWILAALYAALAVSVAFGSVYALHIHSVAQTQTLLASSAPKYVVVMVLDGARPDYLDVASLPHLGALRARGTQFTNAVSGILEAETPSGHATLATGSRPDRSGVLGFDWGNGSDRYSLFSPDKMGSLVQLMQDAGAPTIAGLYKQRYAGAKVVALSGHKYYAAAPLGGPNADAIMYYQGDPQGRYVPVAVPGHTPPAGLLTNPAVIGPTTHLPDGGENALATKLAVQTVKTMRPRVLLINYPEFDWPLGHVDGGSLDNAKVTTMMRGFDVDLGRIEDQYRQLGILDKTMFVITADHGMMPITRFVPSSVISNAIAKAGATAPDVSSSTGTFVWLTDATKSQAVAQNVLNAHDAGIASAYYLTTLGGKPSYVSASSNVDPATESANQYLLNSLLNGHEPSVVIFGKEGVSFSDPNSKWKADHGGNSWQSQHIPLIFSGAGIRPGVVTQAPAQLDDVAPTVLTASGVKPTGMEGRALTDALDVSQIPDQQSRLSETSQLDPILAAMRQGEGS